MKKNRIVRITAIALCLALTATLAACGGGTDAKVVDLNALTLDQIIAEAKKEGKLESVGMPDPWANWGETWKEYSELYGIEHKDTDMSSGEEIAMFETEKNSPTKDIGDVGHAFGNTAKEKGVTQSYKTSYWDSVPDWAKDPEGHWMIAYVGATTFLSNTDIIKNPPKSWADVKAGDYKITLGDVVTGATGQGTVLASCYAFGGDIDNIQPGIDFWKEMAKAGRIDQGDILPARIQKGEVALGVAWSYTMLNVRDQTPDITFEYCIPSDGAVTNGYASIINKYAPHPHAAALAREFIFSDEGQINLAKGYAIPTRTDVVIPQEVQDAGISSEEVANAIPITDPVKWAEVSQKIAQAWQEEVMPLMS